MVWRQPVNLGGRVIYFVPKPSFYTRSPPFWMVLKQRGNGGQHSRSLNIDTQESHRAATEAAPWDCLHSLKPSPSVSQASGKEMGLCAAQSPTGAMCVAFTCGNSGKLSPQTTKQLHQESPVLWVLWLSGYLVSDQVKGSLGEGKILNFPLYSILSPTFLWKQMGGWGGSEIMDYIWLWNWWLIPLVSMETDIGRGKYIVLNKFNSYFLPPSTVALKTPKADTF